MNKLYIEICFKILLGVITFGYLGPYLVSSPSTELVILGLILVVITSIIIIKLTSKLIDIVLQKYGG